MLGCPQAKKLVFYKLQANNYLLRSLKSVRALLRDWGTQKDHGAHLRQTGCCKACSYEDCGG